MTTIKVTALSFALLGIASTDSVLAEDLVMAYSGSLQDPAMVCSIQTVSNEIAELLEGSVEMHVGGTGFATPQNLYSQLQRGVTDISIMPLAYTPGRFPMSEIIGLPFISTNNTTATIAANRLLEEYLSEEYSGTHPLAVMGISAYQLHLAAPVDDLTTDLDGLRIRVTGDTLSTTVRDLGADIVGLPIFQVYENMQKGVIDGFVLPNVPLQTFKLHEVSSHHVQMDFGLPVLYMGLSNRFWESLTPEQQAIVEEKYAGPEAAARYVDCFNQQDAAALALALESPGSSSRHMDDSEQTAIAAIATPVIDAYRQGLDEQGLRGTEFLEAFKAEMDDVDASE